MSSFCFLVEISHDLSVQLKESIVGKNEQRWKKAKLNMSFVFVI